jgi:uncharacterized membrane protein
MVLLASLVLAFAVVHALPSHAVIMAPLRARLGPSFGAVYAFAAVLLLASMIWAFRRAESTTLYDLKEWGRYMNFVLSLLGFICVGIFLFRGSWRQSLRYPMAIGVGLWATGHLFANGDTRSLLLFGGLAAAAAFQAALMARGPAAPRPDTRSGHNFLSVLAGLALYALMAQLHYFITGAPLVELR